MLIIPFSEIQRLDMTPCWT